MDEVFVSREGIIAFFHMLDLYSMPHWRNAMNPQTSGINGLLV
jgi:hypothetical protein